MAARRERHATPLPAWCRKNSRPSQKFLKTLQVRPSGAPRVVIEGQEGVAAARDAELIVREVSQEATPTRQ